MTQRALFPYLAAVAALVLILSSCAFVSKELKTGEEQLVKNPPPPHKIGLHVLIFAMDGACRRSF